MSEIRKLQTASELAIQNMPEAIMQTLKTALMLVTQTATGKFMIQTGTGKRSKFPGVNVPVDASRLTMRTANLVRSLIRGDHPQHIQELQIRGQLFIGSVGTRVKYARIHEQGGVIPSHQISITERMRKKFWAMFYVSGREEFKFAALTKKNAITIPDIVMKARPYLEPAIQDDETQQSIVEQLGAGYQAEVKEAMRSALKMA
jgi:phage gpG-like protein